MDVTYGEETERTTWNPDLPAFLTFGSAAQAHNCILKGKMSTRKAILDGAKIQSVGEDPLVWSTAYHATIDSTIGEHCTSEQDARMSFL
jgi:hypothetical protein